jgi:hypothetical protein
LTRLQSLALAIATFATLSRVTACSDRVEVVVRSAPDAAVASATDAARAGAGGGADADAGADTTTPAAGGAGGASAGQGPDGAAGGSGAGGSASAGSADAGDALDAVAPAEAGAACVRDRDCPRPPTPCAVARCSEGTCSAANAKAGTVIPDVPGDCHDVVCDGLGGVSSRPLDENDVPVFENPCVVGTCNKKGVAGSALLVAGTPCQVAGGDKLCDGTGLCVQCLVQSDCGPGLYCQKDHNCGTTPCTDVACGGGCALCELGGRCLQNSDCRSFACDASSMTCVADYCKDHHKDGYESDVDCGGPDPCPRCPLGGACSDAIDCQTQFCDVELKQCVTTGCADHARDGDETDVDCGGPTCAARCASNQFCKTVSDCQPGLRCSGTPLFCN